MKHESRLSVPGICLWLAVVSQLHGLNWQFETIENTGSWLAPQIGRVDEQLRICYTDSATGRMMLAYRDTGLRIEQVCQHLPAVRPSFSLRGETLMGVSYTGAGDTVHLCEHHGNQWVDAALPIVADGRQPQLGYDLADTARIVFAPDNHQLSLASRVDTTWRVETFVAAFDFVASWSNVAFGAQNTPEVLAAYQDHPGHTGYLSIFYRRAGTWHEEYISVTVGMPFVPLSLTSAPDTSARSLGAVWNDYRGPRGTRWGQTLVESTSSSASIRRDEDGNSYIALVESGTLIYRWQDSGGALQRDTVVPSGVSECGLVLNSDHAPVIAFTLASGGVRLAYGPRTGVHEVPERREGLEPLRVYLVGKRLCLENMEKAILVNSIGRKVRDLHEGLNELSGIPAGTYFVVVKSRNQSSQFKVCVVE